MDCTVGKTIQSRDKLNGPRDFVARQFDIEELDEMTWRNRVIEIARCISIGVPFSKACHHYDVAPDKVRKYLMKHQEISVLIASAEDIAIDDVEEALY